MAGVLKAGGHVAGRVTEEGGMEGGKGKGEGVGGTRL